MRTRVMFGAALACCLLGYAASAEARHGRPPAASGGTARPVDYNKDRDELLGQIKALYFAIGCKVVPSEASLTPYIQGISQAFEARAHEGGVHPSEAARMKQAAGDGMAQAREAGACAFWQQHPDMARNLRGVAAPGR